MCAATLPDWSRGSLSHCAPRCVCRRALVGHQPLASRAGRVGFVPYLLRCRAVLFFIDPRLSPKSTAGLVLCATTAGGVGGRHLLRLVFVYLSCCAGRFRHFCGARFSSPAANAIRIPGAARLGGEAFVCRSHSDHVWSEFLRPVKSSQY